MAWVRHAIGEISVHDPETGERQGAVRSPVSAPSGGCPPGATRCGSPTPTTSPPRASTATTPAPARPPSGRPPRAEAELPEIESHQIVYQSADGTRSGWSCSAGGCRGRARASSTATAGSGCRSRPPTPPMSCPGWRRAASSRSPRSEGGEEGEGWHRAGMRGRKQNSFDDFAAAAETLIAAGWTRPDLLGVTGESGGGLLVGALVTQRPELVAAAVCSRAGARHDQIREVGARELVGAGIRLRRRPRAVRPGCWPTRPITTSRRGSTIRRPCSPSSTATAGSTRSTPARCAPRYRARPPACGRSCSATRTGVGHAGRSADRAAGLAADMLAFLARELGGLSRG